MLDFPALYVECAPEVHPATMAAVVRVESGGNPLAININRYPGSQLRPRSREEAVATAKRFIAAGYSVDMGLGQVNSVHGHPVERLFEPCANLRASARVLVACYGRASLGAGSDVADRLKGAFSCYNTGTLHRGQTYAAKVMGGAAPATVSRASAAALPARPGPPPAWGGVAQPNWTEALPVAEAAWTAR